VIRRKQAEQKTEQEGQQNEGAAAILNQHTEQEEHQTIEEDGQSVGRVEGMKNLSGSEELDQLMDPIKSHNDEATNVKNEGESQRDQFTIKTDPVGQLEGQKDQATKQFFDQVEAQQGQSTADSYLIPEPGDHDHAGIDISENVSVSKAGEVLATKSDLSLEPVGPELHAEKNDKFAATAPEVSKKSLPEFDQQKETNSKVFLACCIAVSFSGILAKVHH
jgi:hypothetical protein